MYSYAAAAFGALHVVVANPDVEPGPASPKLEHIDRADRVMSANPVDSQAWRRLATGDKVQAGEMEHDNLPKPCNRPTELELSGKGMVCVCVSSARS